MSKPEFTPGPWEWNPNELYQMEIPYETILEKGCSGGYDSCGGYIQWGPNEKANANLIASAPDMYEALSEAISIFEILHPMNSEEPCLIYDAWRKAKQALAKAGG